MNLNRWQWLHAASWAALAVGVACSSGNGGTMNVTGPGGSSSGGSGAGNAGNSGNTGNTSESGSSGGGQSTGSLAGASGTVAGGASGSVAQSGSSPSGGTGSGSPSTSGSTTTSGTTAASGAGATGSASGAVASSGTSSGAGSGTTSASGASSGSTIAPRQGKSSGCGQPPVGANSGGFTDHVFSIPVCTGCSAMMGNCPATCIAPEFAPGGVASQTNAGENFTKRDYAIQLPNDYDPNTAYPVFYGGGGCGGAPPQHGNGFGVGATNAILVGLQYVDTCFADGGTSCSGSIMNEPLCVNGPELPYLRTIMSQVESAFCVDLGKEFVGGYSSGGWEAMTLGCGAAGLLRGFVSDEGGKREHRWPCTGPIAGLMVAGEADTVNPIGQPDQPNVPFNQSLDAYGSAHERIELLARNSCVGTATAMYDPKYPDCQMYTGCPKEYPVVWCPLPGAGHNDSSDGPVNYSPGNVQGDPLMWNFLSNLPAVQ